MDNYFDKTDHVFVIRVRQETTSSYYPLSSWRGVIKHLPSGTKQSINKLDDVTHFVRQHLGLTQAKSQGSLKFRRWIQRLLG